MSEPWLVIDTRSSRCRLALTSGFQRAFLIGTGLLLATAVIASVAANTRAGRRAGEPTLGNETVPETA